MAELAGLAGKELSMGNDFGGGKPAGSDYGGINGLVFQSEVLHLPTKSAVSATNKYILARRAAPRMQVPNHPEAPVIVSNIPVPGEARGGLRKFDHYYPFEDMKPGDSFWVPSATQCTAGAVTKFAKKSGWKFISRAQALDGRKNTEVGKAHRGTRVWRTA